MITTSDIANILYKDCEVFRIAIVPDGKTLTGDLKKERITIHSKRQQSEATWKKSFVEVNLCVPDMDAGNADTIRLGELERLAQDVFEKAGCYDGINYEYSIESIGREADTALKCHYVNVRILFNVLNVK